MPTLLWLASFVALGAVVVNLWATVRVLRFEFTNGQRAAQVALIWLLPGFCVLSLFVTRQPVHTSVYQGIDNIRDDHAVHFPHHGHESAHSDFGPLQIERGELIELCSMRTHRQLRPVTAR
jgi:hypothetical protein